MAVVTRMHSIELLPDAAGHDLVRADWTALTDAGLPSLADNTNASNAPHVTVVGAPSITAEHERLAVDLVAPMLPLTARVSGLGVLEGKRGRRALARLVEAPDPFVEAVLRLREAVGDRRYGGWLPHLSASLRLRPEQLGPALDALPDLEDATVTFTVLRRWDPEAGETRDLWSAPAR
ncbi:2'-5' RNA ligase family protein [Nocardioides marinquilinus]|uniref:2'-5' RNA ligase family protein n=1 Tax=Nocardioides marinquilinus TaxID=1210400 RepID=UPI0031F13B8A